MITTKDIRNWQVDINDPAAIVEGIDDIRQCIHIILTTVPGSDPLRPEFGSNVYKYLDQPLPVAKPQIIYAVTEAVGRWEKRLEVTKCNIIRRTVDRTTITIEGIVVASADQVTITTTL